MCVDVKGALVFLEEKEVMKKRECKRWRLVVIRNIVAIRWYWKKK